MAGRAGRVFLGAEEVAGLKVGGSKWCWSVGIAWGTLWVDWRGLAMECSVHPTPQKWQQEAARRIFGNLPFSLGPSGTPGDGLSGNMCVYALLPPPSTHSQCTHPRRPPHTRTNTCNPGNKILRKPLIGEKIVTYYPNGT